MMRKVSLVLSLLGLVLTVVPSFLVFFQVISKEENAKAMGVGMMIWFLTAWVWKSKKTPERSTERSS